VPEPVALARGAEERLITREIPGGRRLDEHLFENYFEPLPDEPPYPGARPPDLVAIHRHDMDTRGDLVTPAGVKDGLLCGLDIGMIQLAGEPHGRREVIRPNERRIEARCREDRVGRAHTVDVL
jgi:hypothetical protein